MKKIVALVLAMVMVLGLATTAFAALPAYMAAAGTLGTPDTTWTVNGTDTDLKLSAYDYKLEEQVGMIAVSRTFAKQVVWATNKVTKGPVMIGEFVLATSAKSADYAFVNGSEITYLANYANNSVWDLGMNVTKVATVSVDDAAACGDVFTEKDYAVYVDAEKNYYVENGNGTILANCDGKLVKLASADAKYDVTAYAWATANAVQLTAIDDNDVVFLGHRYNYDGKSVNGTIVATKVFCKDCKAEFAFVQGYESQAIAEFKAGNYVYAMNVAGTKGDINSIWVALPGAAAAPSAPAAGETVESAKTFDAGIAMYVGMSVMAAAGSAVVLKKKD